MKAFVKYGKSAHEARLMEVPVPEPGEGEVLLQVAACGLCGSDLHAYLARSGYEWVVPPIVLGHEFTGTVQRAGVGIAGFKAGDRAVVLGIQGCHRCRPCRSGDTNLCAERRVIGLNMDGGMAEYAVVKADSLVRVPEGLDPAVAAITEPLSVAIHAVDKGAFYPGQRVVVTGPGPIGLYSAAYARLHGAKVLLAGLGADARARIPAAERIGLRTVNMEDLTWDEALKSAFGGEPLDVWVEASGDPRALEASFAQVRRGGTVVVVAIYAQPFSWFATQCVRGEHSLYFSYASTCRDYELALDLLSDGLKDLEASVTRYSLEDAEKAFRDAEERRVVKPVIVP